MNDLESMAVDRAKHAIGLDDARPYHRHRKAYYKPYRNYYGTFADDKIWCWLEDSGYAARRDSTREDGAIFVLTRLDWIGWASKSTYNSELGGRQ